MPFLLLEIYAAPKLISVAPFAEPKGTRTVTSVPSLGVDEISIVAFIKLARSRILIRPRPLLDIAASASKPSPQSRTVNWISPEIPRRRTSKHCVPLYLIALFNDSCRILNRHKPTSRGTSQGTSSAEKLTVTLLTVATSRQWLLHAATSPRYSSFEECKRWDIACTSMPISDIRRRSPFIWLRSSWSEPGKPC